MTQVPPPTPGTFPRAIVAGPRSGLAIAAMVCGIVGLTSTLACGLTFVVGLVGLILGIVALVKIRRNPAEFGGRGMAITGIVTGGLSVLIFIVYAVAILPTVVLSTMGKVRDDARRLKSSAQLQNIGMALQLYAADNKGWMPEAGADLASRLTPAYASADVFASPFDDPGHTDGYLYVAPGVLTDKITNAARLVLAYENPEIYHVGRFGGHVLYADGRVEYVSQPGYQRSIDAIKAGKNPPRR